MPSVIDRVLHNSHNPVITPAMAREVQQATSQERPDRMQEDGQRTSHVREWVRSTMDSGVTKIISRGWDELSAEHAIDPSFNAGNFSLGLKVSEDILQPGELSPLQKQVALDLAASENKSVVWVKTQTMIKPGLGIRPDLNAHVDLDFDVNTQLVLEVTQPLLFDDLGSGLDAAKQALKSHSVSHPLKSEAAFALPPGASYKVIGRGTASASLSVGSSGDTGVLGDYIDAGYGARAGVRGSREGIYEVAGEILKDGSLRVVVSEIDKQTRSISASAWVGLRAQPAIEDELFDKIPALDGNFVGRALGGAVYDQIKQRVEKVKASLSAGASSGNQHKVLSSYHFDGSPNARKNYDDGLPLNLAKLDRAAENPAQSGVNLVRYTVDEDSALSHVRLDVLGRKLFLLSGTTRTEHGVLVAGDDTTIHTAGSYSKERSFGPWSHSSMGEAVHVERTQGDATRVEDYVHVRYQREDAVPREGEVERLRNFTAAMGVPGAEKIIDTESNFFVSLFDRGDNIKFDCDLYFTDQGAKQIVNASPEERRAAIALAASQIAPKVGVVQINNPEARAIAEEYQRKQNEVDNTNSQNWQWDLARQYAELIHRDPKDVSSELADHMEVFRMADLVERHVARFAAGGGEWPRLFPDMMKDMAREDYMVVLPAMRALAGADNLLVHSFHISDKDGRINLDVPDEGIIRHPGADANGAIYSNNG